ncbi:hypothetical protein ACWCQQ_50445, partial [Streptomyces sp. NPDC002143]
MAASFHKATPLAAVHGRQPHVLQSRTRAGQVGSRTLMLLRTSPSTSTGTLIIPDWKQAWVVTM